MLVQIPAERGGWGRSFLPTGCGSNHQRAERHGPHRTRSAPLGQRPHPRCPRAGTSVHLSCLSTCPICPPAGWEPLLEGVRKNPSISEKMRVQKAAVAWFVTSRRQSLSWFCCEGRGNEEKELVSPPAMSWAMSLYPQTYFFLPGF